MNRRQRWDIWAELLTVALKSAGKTKLMYQGNLGHTAFEKHLQALTGMGFLEEKGNPQRFFKTTQKGKEWLRYYTKLRSLGREIRVTPRNF